MKWSVGLAAGRNVAVVAHGAESEAVPQTRTVYPGGQTQAMPHENQGAWQLFGGVRWTTALPGALALSIGLIGTTGWMLGIPGLVEWHPGWGAMVLTTCICALLSGAGLLGSVLSNDKLVARLQLWLGTLVFLIAAITILEKLTDRNLGIDFASLHAAMLPNYPPPGRMGPNTALSFLLFGTGLCIPGLTRKAGVVRVFAASVFLLGGLGLAGYCLGVRFLYGWYTSSGLVQMSLPASLVMMLLGSGLWSHTNRYVETNRPEETEPQILRTIVSDTMTLMLITAVAIAATGVAFLQDTVFRYTAQHLSQLELGDQELIESAIDHLSERAAVAGGGAWLSQLLRTWDSDSGVQRSGNSRAQNDSTDEMRLFAANLLTQGFSGVIYRGSSRQTLQIGKIVVSPAIRAPFHHVVDGDLIWSNGYYLETVVQTRDKQGISGEMLAQQPMPTLDRLAASINASSETGAFMLCARQAEGAFAACFPTRLQPLPFLTPVPLLTPVSRAAAAVAPRQVRSAGEPLGLRGYKPFPLQFALAGHTGAVLTFDARQHPVTAAYSPIENSALGLVLKIDTAETFAPIRRSLTIALPLLLLIALIGLRLMQRRLAPLVDGLVHSREQIQQLALHDPLTGLPNRSLMDDRMRMALEWGRRNGHSVAVALVDLDGFKLVNDNFGHEVGDTLLTIVARRLEGCVRASDTVARLGGDEFVLILNEIYSRDAISVMAEKILSSFSNPVDLAGQAYVIEVSLGFAISPQGEGEPLALMRQADQAMYSAKNDGGCRFALFNPSSELLPDGNSSGNENATARSLRADDSSLDKIVWPAVTSALPRSRR